MKGRHSTSHLWYIKGIPLKVNSKGAGKKDPLGSQALKSSVGSNRVKSIDLSEFSDKKTQIHPTKTTKKLFCVVK